MTISSLYCYKFIMRSGWQKRFVSNVNLIILKPFFYSPTNLVSFLVGVILRGYNIICLMNTFFKKKILTWEIRKPWIIIYRYSAASHQNFKHVTYYSVKIRDAPNAFYTNTRFWVLSGSPLVLRVKCVHSKFFSPTNVSFLRTSI